MNAAVCFDPRIKLSRMKLRLVCVSSVCYCISSLSRLAIILPTPLGLTICLTRRCACVDRAQLRKRERNRLGATQSRKSRKFGCLRACEPESHLVANKSPISIYSLRCYLTIERRQFGALGKLQRARVSLRARRRCLGFRPGKKKTSCVNTIVRYSQHSLANYRGLAWS